MQIQTEKKFAYLFGILADHELDFDAFDAARAAAAKKVPGATSFCDPVVVELDGTYSIKIQKEEE